MLRQARPSCAPRRAASPNRPCSGRLGEPRAPAVVFAGPPVPRQLGCPALRRATPSDRRCSGRLGRAARPGGHSDGPPMLRQARASWAPRGSFRLAADAPAGSGELRPRGAASPHHPCPGGSGELGAPGVVSPDRRCSGSSGELRPRGSFRRTADAQAGSGEPRARAAASPNRSHRLGWVARAWRSGPAASHPLLERSLRWDARAAEVAPLGLPVPTEVAAEAAPAGSAACQRLGVGETRGLWEARPSQRGTASMRRCRWGREVGRLLLGRPRPACGWLLTRSRGSHRSWHRHRRFPTYPTFREPKSTPTTERSR